MRATTTLLTLLFLLAAAPAPEPAVEGIELSDIDRNADPCGDFYAFANGSWRANNPIPPSMSRWSRRWAAGDSTKDKLRGILEEV